MQRSIFIRTFDINFGVFSLTDLKGDLEVAEVACIMQHTEPRCEVLLVDVLVYQALRVQSALFALLKKH